MIRAQNDKPLTRPAVPGCSSGSTPALRVDYDIPAYIRRGIRIAELERAFGAGSVQAPRLAPGGCRAQQPHSDPEAHACEQQPDQP